MLSSQTLDTVTAPTIWNMQKTLPHGLNLRDMLDIEEGELDRLIGKVGFHRKKAAYIKRTAEILRDKWGGDIPGSVEGLCSLPGVGEKMAHLCMSAAWKKYPPLFLSFYFVPFSCYLLFFLLPFTFRSFCLDFR